MKRANLFHLLAAMLLLAALSAGCKKNPKNITPIGSSRSGAIGSEGPAGPILDTGGAIDRGSAIGSNLSGSELASPLENADEDYTTLSAQSIFFDFDRSAIKTSEQGKLDQVATYMKSAPAREQLRLEGNCDERGTEEYNRALGERRAIAARDYLIQKHGIESGRLTTISYGESKPRSLEKTEEAYAQNRRVDFVILRPR